MFKNVSEMLQMLKSKYKIVIGEVHKKMKKD